MSTAPALRPRPPRVPFVRPISLRPVDGSREAQWLLAGNLSLGGCFVRTAKPMPVGSEVRLELEAHGKPLPFAVAEVVWSRGIGEVPSASGLPGCGLRFKSLSAEARALVMHLVDLGGTGRGQSRTQPLGMTVVPRNPTREPLHAPVGLIRDFLQTPPQALAAPPPTPSLQLVRAAEAVTDPHGTPASPTPPAPKVVVDLTASPTKASPLGPRPSPPPLGVGPVPARSEPWFDAAKPQQRAAEPTFEAASVGPVPAPLEAPPRHGASWFSSILAGMAVGGAILGALVLAQNGLRLAKGSGDGPPPHTAAPPSGTLASVPDDEHPAPEHPAPARGLGTPPVGAAKAPLAAAPAPTVEARVSVSIAPLKDVVTQVVQVPEAPSPSGPAGDEILLPTGAAKGVRVAATSTALDVEPELAAGGSISRVFTLDEPPRLVIDLDGSKPHGSPRVEGRGGVAAIRLGTRPGGTRLVLDLEQPAHRVRTEGNRITVELN